MLITPPERIRQSGFAIVSAIFIVVALAALGAFVAVVSSTQHLGSALDIDGARAYQSARAGIEWGVANALQGNCAAASNIGPLNGMAMTVECSALASGNADEAGLLAIYAITATACNLPAGAACPGVAGASNYIERRMTIVVER